jgi:hypothetical protein
MKHFIVKICENYNFLIHSQGKSKGNRIVAKFGPFSLSDKNPSIFRPLIYPAAHFFTACLLHAICLPACRKIFE